MGMCVAGLGALGVSVVYILTKDVDVAVRIQFWEHLQLRCLRVLAVVIYTKSCRRRG